MGIHVCDGGVVGLVEEARRISPCSEYLEPSPHPHHHACTHDHLYCAIILLLYAKRWLTLLKINCYFNNGLVTGVASMLGPFCQSGQLSCPFCNP